MLDLLNRHPIILSRAQDAPHALGPTLAEQFSWNYDHVASLWEHEKWIPESAVSLAKAHYSAYMVRRQDGLRIITLNTDLCEYSTINRHSYPRGVKL